MRVILLGFSGRNGVLEEAERLGRASSVMRKSWPLISPLSRTFRCSMPIWPLSWAAMGRFSAQPTKWASQLPVLGVNLGRLGFLADLSPRIPGCPSQILPSRGRRIM